MEKVLFTGRRFFFLVDTSVRLELESRNATPLTGARPNPMAGRAG